MIRTRVRTWVVGCALVASLATLCAPACAAEAAGGESPEAAYAELQAAAETRDTVAFTRLLEASSHPGWVIQLHILVGKLVFASEASGATREAWFKVADAHGFKADAVRFDSLGLESKEDADAYLDDFAQRLREHGASEYVAAILAFIDDKMKEEGYSSSFLGSVPTGPPDGVDYVDENRAIVRAEGKTYRFFRSQDGRWYFSPHEPLFN